MKIVAAVFLIALNWVHAQGPAAPAAAASTPKTPCDALAADKKLSGDARVQFLNQCNDNAASEAKAACDAKAAEKKLAGQAKANFTKQCLVETAKI
jgi:hypothetical protein